MANTVKRAIAITGTALAGAGVATLCTPPVADAFPGQEGIIRCESGGNPTAVNNTAAGIRAGRPAGLFQIVTGTWRAYGGAAFASTADRASVAQQQIVADRIYEAHGTSPWACKPGGGSGGVIVPVPVAVAPATGKQVVVTDGDILFDIAQRFYGDGHQWPKLYDANRQTVGGNPDLIFPGQMLVIA